MMFDDEPDTLAHHAARLVVEEGLEYAEAKRKAARQLNGGGRGRRAELPSDDVLEDAVREYLAIFAADTQPGELRALRELAQRWMQRVSEFRPHLGGAVWRGTATRLSSLRIDLYCDEPKMVEIAFLNQGWDFDSRGGEREGPLVLTLAAPCRDLGESVTLHFIVHDADAVRGALQPDARGQSWRGDLHALNRLLASA